MTIPDFVILLAGLALTAALLGLLTPLIPEHVWDVLGLNESEGE